MKESPQRHSDNGENYSNMSSASMIPDLLISVLSGRVVAEPCTTSARSDRLFNCMCENK